ncbi:cytochrome o ubiquinol/quinol oxidase subunit IV [Kangiella sp. TOML190]|uniref:cytochrome o ubiquinol oxidase subunit IV n=1 Tax=Kangiella sp. TOML190 TaxID=2931351 RepID=UPI00203D176B|nr:cytochrome C oxidase subunit IV family protein [Kangiella sp. TOML190]
MMKPVHLRKPHLTDYIYGFILAVILTVIPFTVASHGDDVGYFATVTVITVMAIIQVVVQLRFFLHYTTDRVPIEARIALFLASFMVIVMIFGSLWVMGNLGERMMP